MKILAVETSGKTFSAALNEDNTTIASYYYEYGHIHSEIIIPSLE
jgi:tRNA threonylcarbamoyladenosine biosynthesis protein TsaB